MKKDEQTWCAMYQDIKSIECEKKFKVGDTVKLLSTIGVPDNISIGDIATIKSVTQYGYLIITKKDNNVWIASDNDLELVTTEFKVGDIVEVLTSLCVPKHVSIGDIAIIEKLGKPFNIIKMIKDGRKWDAYDTDMKLIERKEKPTLKKEVVKKPSTSNPTIFKVGVTHTNHCDFIKIGNITIAVPPNTPLGVSYKHEDDCENIEIGQALAFQRMFKRYVEMEKGVK